MAAWQATMTALQVQKLVYPAYTLVLLVGAPILIVPAVIILLCCEVIVQVTIPVLATQAPTMLAFLSANHVIQLAKLAMDQHVVTA